jgi:hypothetical protein
MRTLTVIVVLGILLLAGPPLGHAVTYEFFTQLDGASENPPNNSPAIGMAMAVLDDTAHTLRLAAIFSGLEANTAAAHVHCCIAPPANVAVVVVPPSLPGFPLGVTSGIYDNTLDTLDTSTYSAAFVTNNGGTASGAEAALLAGLLAGEAYFNIHTTLRRGGEIRGFFAAVPEPGTLGLCLVGLVVIAVMIGAKRAHWSQS